MLRMRLLLGTTNPGKAARLRHYLRELPIDILLASDHAPGLVVAETGSSPEKNARIKATAYFEASMLTSLGEDAALEIEGLDGRDQPGAHVRRIGAGGATVSDQAMILYYSRLLGDLGGRTRGCWTSGIDVSTVNGVFSRTLRSTTVFVAEASDTVVAGQPLRSLQVDPASNRYLSEMTNEELDAIQGERATGVGPFVRKCLGLAD